MVVTIETQNTGDPRASKEILAGVEHVLSDAAGEWRVSIVGSRADDNSEMKVEGDSSARTLWLAKSTSLRQYGTCFLSCFPPETAVIYHVRRSSVPVKPLSK